LSGEDEGDGSTLGTGASPDTSFLQRIFEEGPNGFRIADIGRTITTTEGLRQLLDGLDDTPNNVTLTEANGVTRYDVHVNKTLDGSTGFAVDALGGRIDLAGAIEASVDIAVHLVLGVDPNGFFLDANGPDPEFVLKNVRVSGDVSGTGRLGFLEVSLEDATLAVDPELAVTLDLHDTGTDPLTNESDGLIRTYELGPLADLVTARVEGGSSTPDVVLTGTFGLGLVLGGDEPFTLADARLALKWEDVSDLTKVTVEAVTPTGQTL